VVYTKTDNQAPMVNNVVRLIWIVGQFHQPFCTFFSGGPTTRVSMFN